MNRIIEKDYVKTLESRINTSFISIKEDHATIRQTMI